MNNAGLITGKLLFLLLVAVFFASMSITTVQAATNEDRKRIHTPFYDENSQEAVTCGSSVNLAGNDNAEKVWNFLTAPGRLQPWQAAGVMGNMEAESHYEPRLVQYGKLNSRAEVSQPGQASSLDDTPPAGSDTGYGIVQFTPATKILPAASRLGMPPGDLGFQLTLLWEQLNGESEIPEKPAGDHLKQTTTVEEAVVSFELKYERHAPDASGPIRLQFARDRLAQFGSGTGSGGSGGVSSELRRRKLQLRQIRRHVSPAAGRSNFKSS